MRGGAGFQERMQRIEVLIQTLDRLTDPQAKEGARALVQALLDVHGAGLARVLEILSRAGDHGRALTAELAQDDLVASLLLLHGLHPVDLATRVRRALDEVRPVLRSHGGDVELLGVTGGAVRLRLRGGGGASSATHLQRTVEDAIVGAAPDVATIEVDGPADDGTGPRPGRVSLPLIGTPR